MFLIGRNTVFLDLSFNTRNTGFKIGQGDFPDEILLSWKNLPLLIFLFIIIYYF